MPDADPGQEPLQPKTYFFKGIRFLFIFALIGCIGWCRFAFAQASSEGIDEEVFSVASLVPSFILLLTMLTISALTSAAETALFSLDKLDVTKLRTSERWVDKKILDLLSRPNDALITILITNNIVNISVSLTSGTIMVFFVPENSTIGFICAAFIATVGILVFGEIIPKLLASMNPPLTARLLTPLFALAAWFLRPLQTILSVILKSLFGVLRLPEGTPTVEEIASEELKIMISSEEIANVLDEGEKEMIDSVFSLRETSAVEIMTPRTSIIAVPDDLTQSEMLERLSKNTNSRILVYHESLDAVTGFLLVKEVLLDPEGDWKSHLREAILAPEGIGLLTLLRRFRKERTKIAVIVDEYGGIAGLVSLQDLLEEIVGDIYEHHERVEPSVERLGEYFWKILGELGLDELSELCGIEFPEDRGRTAGGFVMNMLGRIPEPGDTLNYQGLRLTVETMSGRRVKDLKVERLAEPTSESI